MSSQTERSIPPRMLPLARVLAWSLGALLVALVGALLYANLSFDITGKDLQDLTRFLLISGAASVALGAVSFRLGVGMRLPSLWVAIAVVYLVGAAVVAVNVLYTALLMFVSPHDLGLLTVLLLFSALISLFFAVFLSQSIVSRLRSLLFVAMRVSDGDFTVRSDDRSHDEIGRLSSELNAMVAQLQRSAAERDKLEASRRALIAAVSHDLRTPLASIRAMVEALNDGVVNDPGTVSRYLYTIQNESLNLTSLIDDLFELSQIDAGALKLHIEPASVADLLSDALASMTPPAEKKGIRLISSVEGDVARVPLDAQRMQRVLYNLIQNAISYTPAGGAIAVTLLGKLDTVELTVADSGEGIASNDLPYVFDRFYRGERSRTRGNSDPSGLPGSGAGLGLAIARGIVEAHGGAISAQSEPGAGATFTVSLPRSAGGVPAISL